VAKKILLLASGSGSLAQAIFDAGLSGRAEFVGLISDKDSLALERARNFGVKDLYLPMKADRAEWNSEIFKVTESLQPDLVVSVGFMRVLAPDYVAHFQVMNTHPALLPLFPGAHAVRDALAAGAVETGTTVHWVDAGVDTGPIIAQRVVAIEPGDTEESLHERIKIAERNLIVETLTHWIDGALTQ
jgi:phosphoribosylglycinamide formyltransferase-1